MPLIAGAKTKAAPEDTAFIVLFLLGFKFPRSGLVQHIHWTGSFASPGYPSFANSMIHFLITELIFICNRSILMWQLRRS
jgi:hypothetical protein